MRIQPRVAIAALLVVLSLLSLAPQVHADPQTEDLTHRLQEIYDLRARWLLTDDAPPEIDRDYTRARTAKWALEHEYGKIRYLRQWAQNRKVRFIQSKPTIKVKQLRVNDEKARFYVEQSLALGYVYPNEEHLNLFGVGTRHIIELKRQGEQWLINMEWYTDPLGDDTEVPDVTPALMPAIPTVRSAAAAPIVVKKGYDREGAVRYADQYCGVAWGCGNENRYNPRFRDYNGVGGDCTNFAAQVLREGGGLKVPIFTRVDGLAGHLQYSGRGSLASKGPFQQVMKAAMNRPGGFPAWLKPGDMIAYQEKGEMAHFGVVTGFDSHGYPLVNSHTADRYHVPFDLGWDRKTVYWLFKLRD
ncbi:MAG TPA: amidase domain-containing protein [Symbiobacteriaceae bacterium]|nr:amidase domain-containing protein [Symbiobacteriaceae bacterium]